jgi:DNA-binding CsgD family transcriptional regulator
MSDSDSIKLGSREQECLSMLAQGKRPAEIGAELGITYKTVEKHIGNARCKLAAKTTIHAVAIAIDLNLIQI